MLAVVVVPKVFKAAVEEYCGPKFVPLDVHNPASDPALVLAPPSLLLVVELLLGSELPLVAELGPPLELGDPVEPDPVEIGVGVSTPGALAGPHAASKLTAIEATIRDDARWRLIGVRKGPP